MTSKISDKKKNSLRGKKARAAGRRFEAKVREDLERMGWVVDKWTNTIDYDREGKIGKVVPAKRKYNPFRKAMVIGTGFPDFVCFKSTEEKNKFEVVGVEVKSKGYLDKIEKDMCLWLIENKIFSRILIARKKLDGRKIKVEYKEFEHNKT